MKIVTSTWFECKVAMERPAEGSGAMKKVKEQYTVDALSFTEAESRIIEEMTPFITGGFEVAAIRKAKYSEVVFQESEKADKWYKAKIYYIIPDEKTGKENRTAQVFLVQAESLNHASKVIDEFMSGSILDWEKITIDETDILDAYTHYERESDGCKEEKE